MVLGVTDVRQRFVQVLSQFSDKRMETVFRLVYPMMCTDEESQQFMSKLEPHFAVYARQLADARVVSSSVMTDVKFDRNKRIVGTLDVFAMVQTSHYKGRIKAKSFQDYAAGVMDRLFDSFKKRQTIQVHLSKKASFQLINKMVGNDALYRVQQSIDQTVQNARAQAQRDHVLEGALDSFREKHRMKFTGDLVAFLRNNIPPGLLEEDDFHRAWKEFLVEDLMNA